MLINYDLMVINTHTHMGKVYSCLLQELVKALSHREKGLKHQEQKNCGELAEFGM